MDKGHVCQECGNEMRYNPEKEKWYCDNCRHSYVPENVQKSTPMPLKNQSTTAIWLLVIVVLSVVILTFIAAAALYIMVGGIINGPPGTLTGDLEFSESSTEPGVFTGGFSYLSKKVDLEDVSLTITDESLEESGFLKPLVDGGTVVISDGLRCSYTDVNQNREMDTDDIFRLENGASGDMMRFVYVPTGGLIASYTF